MSFSEGKRAIKEADSVRFRIAEINSDNLSDSRAIRFPAFLVHGLQIDLKKRANYIVVDVLTHWNEEWHLEGYVKSADNSGLLLLITWNPGGVSLYTNYNELIDSKLGRDLPKK